MTDPNNNSHGCYISGIGHELNRAPEFLKETWHDVVEQADTPSRRAFLGASVLGTAWLGSHLLRTGIGEPIVNAYEQWRTTDVFENGVANTWPELGVFPGMIVVEPGAKFQSGIFGDGETTIWDNHRMIVSRPVFVRPSLVRAVNHDFEIGDAKISMRTKYKDISPNLLALWLPDQNTKNESLSYIDARDQARYLTPFTRATEPVTAKGLSIEKDVLVTRFHAVERDGNEVAINITYASRLDPEQQLVQRKRIGRCAVYDKEDSPRSLEADIDQWLNDRRFEIV